MDGDIAILLASFCQHLIVNPVLDTGHKSGLNILFSFDTFLILNIFRPTARSELRKVLFLAPSVCGFLFGMKYLRNR